MSAGTFDAYAAYYDLLYAEKDYSAEAAFVASEIRRFAPDARALLEMGCGTGGHARELTTLGFEVHGFDVSSEMVERARALSLSGFTCEVADARTFASDRRFDAAIALFHVVSYLTTNDDLAAAFIRVAAHLPSGAPFGFDVWHGPAVRAQGAEHRVRAIEGPEFSVIREATPDHAEAACRIDVHYDVEVTERATGAVQRFSEVHPMRYLFTHEIAALLDRAGFDLVASKEFLTGGPLSLDTWGAWYVAVKR